MGLNKTALALAIKVIEFVSKEQSEEAREKLEREWYGKGTLNTPAERNPIVNAIFEKTGFPPPGPNDKKSKPQLLKAIDMKLRESGRNPADYQAVAEAEVELEEAGAEAEVELEEARAEAEV